MVILRFRSNSDSEDVLKKLKKMHKFTKELIDCIEENEDEDYDDEVDYRHDKDYDYPHERRGGSRSRYRRGM